MIALLLAVLAAPGLTGDSDAIAGAKPVLTHAKLQLAGSITVRKAGIVAGAGYHAAHAELVAPVGRSEAYGFGDSARDAARDAGRRAAARLAGRHAATGPPAKPPSVDPNGGTLVRLQGVRSFAGFEAALEFLRKRDSTAAVAMLVAGVPTVRLPGTASAAGLAAAARTLTLPDHALQSAKLEGATVILTFEPPPPPDAPPPPGPAVDAEDAPRRQ